MALVRNLSPRDIAYPKKHREVEATCSIVMAEGEKLLQIDTYGSADRAIPGKVSQSLQFDRQGAEELAKLLQQILDGQEEG
ncbi:hypothetical protein [Paracoccus rhizosphaerae]|uniref:Methionyl-tRNA formyltransferase n=1 Tax=Paracoccus rhizosphaerae TaxID=1133347 RepID=A0ABV6CJ78_9RHOB|nr:hypothetical protein [Paracoccus rhizosphaerae]